MIGNRYTRTSSSDLEMDRIVSIGGRDSDVTDGSLKLMLMGDG